MKSLQRLFSSYGGVSFMHVPKNAGTYIGENFFNQDKFYYMNCGHFGWSSQGEPIEKNNPSEISIKFRNLQSSKKILKVGSIRNPFDLLPSIYYHGETRGFNNINVSNKINSFNDFINFSCSNYDNLGFLYDGFFNKDFKCIADVLIRVEKTDDALDEIFDFFEADRADPSKFKKNESVDRPFRDYKKLYSIKQRKMIEKRFRRELKILGYDFFGPLDSKPFLIPKDEEKFLNQKRSLIISYSWKLSNSFRSQKS